MFVFILSLAFHLYFLHLHSFLSEQLDGVDVLDDGIVEGLHQDVPVAAVHDLQLYSQGLEAYGEAVNLLLTRQPPYLLTLCL